MSWPILLFGLSSGASAGAVLVITRFGDALGALTLPLSAFAGGVLSALAVMILFRVGRVRRAEQLIVCGPAVSFLFSALTSYGCFPAISGRPVRCCSGRSAGWGWRVGIICPFRWRVSCCWPGLRRCVGGRWTRCWRASKPPIRWGQRGAPAHRDLSVLRTVHGVSRFADGRDRLCRADGALSGPAPGGRAPPFGRADVRPAGATLLTGGDMLSRSLIPNQELPIGIITAGLGARSSCPCCCARNDERAPCEDKVVSKARAGCGGGPIGRS